MGSSGSAPSCSARRMSFSKMSGALSAGLVVAEILKSGNWLAIFVEFEGSGGRIAGKVWAKARPGGSCTLLNARRALRVLILMLKGGEPLAEPEGVGGAYGKYPDAALGAAGAAEEMRGAARRGVDEGAVYQSDKRDVLSAKEIAGWILVACAVCAHPPMVSLCEGCAMEPETLGEG